jgi:DNA-binding PucR family transcriptional regulator
MRKVARKAGSDLLLGVQGRRQVAVIGLMTASDKPEQAISVIAAQLEGYFGNGPLILGKTVATVSDAPRSAKSALAAHSVAVSVGSEARPLSADELLPERALAGDALARQTLIETYYLPLAKTSPELLGTLRAYLECGRSLELTAKTLFVHANTVRYRLKRIFEEIAADPTHARTAFVLQVALLLGAINDSETGLKR